jgi:hypothetical protein
LNGKKNGAGTDLIQNRSSCSANRFSWKDQVANRGQMAIFALLCHPKKRANLIRKVEAAFQPAPKGKRNARHDGGDE